MGTFKHYDSRTSLWAKEIKQNASSNEDVGAKTKGTRRDRERGWAATYSRERSSQSLKLCVVNCEWGWIFIGGGLHSKCSFLFSIEYHIFMSKSYFLFSLALHVQHASLRPWICFLICFLLSLGRPNGFLLEEICFLFFFWQVSSYINAQNNLSFLSMLDGFGASRTSF